MERPVVPGVSWRPQWYPEIAGDPSGTSPETAGEVPEAAPDLCHTERSDDQWSHQALSDAEKDALLIIIY